MRLPLLALVLLAGGCATAAQEVGGDRAAAVGDWPRAERFYRRAVEREPADPELARKHRDAFEQALADYLASSARCHEARDFPCATASLGAARALAPDDREVVHLYKELALEAGARRIAGGIALDDGRFGEARDALHEASLLRSDRELDAQLAYAEAMVRAEELAAKDDREGAVRALEVALRTGEDASRGHAAAALARLRR